MSHRQSRLCTLIRAGYAYSASCERTQRRDNGHAEQLSASGADNVTSNENARDCRCWLMSRMRPFETNAFHITRGMHRTRRTPIAVVDENAHPLGTSARIRLQCASSTTHRLRAPASSIARGGHFCIPETVEKIKIPAIVIRQAEESSRRLLKAAEQARDASRVERSY